MMGWERIKGLVSHLEADLAEGQKAQRFFEGIQVSQLVSCVHPRSFLQTENRCDDDVAKRNPA